MNKEPKNNRITNDGGLAPGVMLLILTIFLVILWKCAYKPNKIVETKPKNNLYP